MHMHAVWLAGVRSFPRLLILKRAVEAKRERLTNNRRFVNDDLISMARDIVAGDIVADCTIVCKRAT